MSKGSKFRPVDRSKFDSSWDRIFNKKPENTWEHNCKHNGKTVLEKGQDCSWCGEKED